MATATASTSTLSLTLTKASLLAALTRVQGAVSTRPTLPVLNNVLMDSTPSGRVRLMSSDLDTSIATAVDATIRGEPQGVTLPAKKLTEFVRECVDGPMSVIMKGDTKATIKAGSARTTLRGIAADEFPNVGERIAEAVDLLTVPAGVLAALAKPVAPCASVEESRPILNGVLLEIGAISTQGAEPTRVIRMVATNGHRLGITETTISGEQVGVKEPGAVTLIVMPKLLALIGSVYKADEYVAIATTPDKHTIVVKGAVTTIAARIIEGPYPNYQQVLPTEFTMVAEAELAPFAQSIRRVNVLASDKTHRISLNVTGKERDAAMTVRTQTEDMGEAEDVVAVQIVRGAVNEGGFRIGFNGAYLLEIMRLTAGERVQLSFGTPERAVLVTPVYGDTLPAVMCRHIVMPLRLME